MRHSNNLNQLCLKVSRREPMLTPHRMPRKGRHKATSAPPVCFLSARVRPVVFMTNVALPAPFNGMSNDDGLTEQEGADAENGTTEQVRLTVSVNPFCVLIVMP